jgi:hypothetical protein
LNRKPKKQVKIGVSPTPSKTSKSEAFPNLNEMRPAWRIERLELCDPFGWHEISPIKLFEVRTKLAEFEKLTWNNVLVERKHLNHTVQRWKLCKEAQRRLSEIALDDLEEVVSLRLSGKERVWGFRIEGAMTLLWWDPNHSVCPSLPA